MPTYEFRCPKGHEFEKFYRSMSAAQLQMPCPTCGKTAERQVSAGAGLVFKGSGFYITDYGKDGKKAATLETPGAKESTSSGTDGGAAKGEPPSKSEKPAVKAELKAAPESKPSGDSRAAVASKSAAKKPSARKKSGE
jgi:putative FmdB family regulatory protein